ncbi:alpha/beta hydrolase [Sphingomonas sp.]|uniref:alpha/beta hydrolase n=1 Tax=Sphingomonas sp. TaxID=28214 RepID=UPI0025E8BD13|nr:alpha/beta hydrolase [Sphingomonas sp.]
MIIKWLKAAGLIVALVCIGMGAKSFGRAPVVRGETASFSCTSVKPQVVHIDGSQAYVFRHASGRDLMLHVFSGAAATGPSPAVMLFFGGGWRAGTVDAFASRARALAARGYVVILPDYRVFCRDRTGPMEAMKDARAAYDWLIAHAAGIGVDQRRIVLGGGSAGGQLALMTTIRRNVGHRPAALVLYNPAIDPGAMPEFLSLSMNASRPISPARQPLDHMPPAIIMHGEADEYVPIATIRAFCVRYRAAGGRCDVEAYPEQRHGFFHKTIPDVLIGGSPYDLTLARTLSFLATIKGLEPR